MSGVFTTLKDCSIPTTVKEAAIERYISLRGSNINIQEAGTGNTFLHYAYICKNPSLVNTLINKYNIDRNIRNNDRLIASDMADLPATVSNVKKNNNTTKKNKVITLKDIKKAFRSNKSDTKKLELLNTYINNSQYNISSYLHDFNSKDYPFLYGSHLDLLVFKNYLENHPDKIVTPLGHILVNVILRGSKKTTYDDNDKELLDLVNELIEKGADVKYIHSKTKRTPLMYAVKYLRPVGIQLVTLLYDKGANITLTDKDNKSAYDYAIEVGNKDIIAFIDSKYLWKGSTKSDFAMYDGFFTDPKEYSVCPICLMYVNRNLGCMYLTHDCTLSGRPYHKELYDKYKYPDHHVYKGKIQWCTYCGRISKEHKHYQLSLANNPTHEFAPIKPPTNPLRARYDDDDCIDSGGGGIHEKVNRMRAMRKQALELQAKVGEIGRRPAMNSLIEAAWNAPILTPEVPKTFFDKIRSREVDPARKVIKEKKWNISLDALPEKINNTNANSTKPLQDVAMPATRQLPINRGKGDTCVIYASPNENTDEDPLFQFQHEDDPNGKSHEAKLICKDDIVTYMNDMAKNFTTESFGKCILYPDCKATLYPAEIKDIVPDALYQTYRVNFNKKFQRGGGATATAANNSVFAEIPSDTLQCALKSYTRKNRRNNNSNRSKTRKN